MRGGNPSKYYFEASLHQPKRFKKKAIWNWIGCTPSLFFLGNPFNCQLQYQNTTFLDTMYNWTSDDLISTYQSWQLEMIWQGIIEFGKPWIGATRVGARRKGGYGGTGAWDIRVPDIRRPVATGCDRWLTNTQMSTKHIVFFLKKVKKRGIKTLKKPRGTHLTCLLVSPKHGLSLNKGKLKESIFENYLHVCICFK